MEKGKKGKSEGGGKYSSVGLAWLGDSEGGGALQISNIRKKKNGGALDSAKRDVLIAIDVLCQN